MFAVTEIGGMISDVEVSRGVCRAGMSLLLFQSWAAKSHPLVQLSLCHKIKTCFNFMQQVKCVLEDTLHILKNYFNA